MYRPRKVMALVDAGIVVQQVAAGACHRLNITSGFYFRACASNITLARHANSMALADNGAIFTWGSGYGLGRILFRLSPVVCSHATS